MQDRSIAAFKALLVKRRGVARRLNEKLAEQRADYAVLEERAASVRRDIDAQQARITEYDAKIEALTCGSAAFELTRLNALHSVHDMALQRRGELEKELAKANTGLERRAQYMAKTRREIVANEAQMELYQTKLDTIRANAERRAEDAQDEETDEQQSARAFRRGG